MAVGMGMLAVKILGVWFALNLAYVVLHASGYLLASTNDSEEIAGA